MRRYIGMLVLATCVATAAAQTVTLTLDSPQNGTTVSAGSTVSWTVSATASTGDNLGLALVSCDLVQDGGNPATFDLPPATGVPAGMENFSRPAGITNPPETDPVTGYVGSQRGAAGAMNLIQIGGAQNTFGEAMPGGTGLAENANVVGGVGQSGPQVMATGSFNAPATEGTYTINLANAFANVLVTLATPPDYSPVTAATMDTSAGSFSFTVGGQTYELGDLNCDGFVNNGDIDPFVMAISDPGAYATTYPGCDIDLGDINGDSFVNNGDIDPFVDLLTGG